MSHLSGDCHRLAKLLERFSDSREEAWQRYINLKNKITKFFRQWKYGAEASELANEVLDRIANTKDLSGIRDLENYAYGVARYVRFEVSRRNRKFLPIETDLAYSDDPESALVEIIDFRKQRDCLQLCMTAWKAESHRIFQGYYLVTDCDQKKHRRQLAETLNITPAALAARAGRLKKKLKKCCMACYESKDFLCLHNISGRSISF
jgi:hypothetical protein